MNDLTVLGQFGAVEVLGDRLVRAWLAGQDEGAAAGLDGLGDRLAGIHKVVAKMDRPERRQGWRQRGPANAWRRRARKSCFSAPSWGVMNGGGSGRTRAWPGAPKGCTEKGMEEIDLAVRVLPARTARAMDFSTGSAWCHLARSAPDHPDAGTPPTHPPPRPPPPPSGTSIRRRPLSVPSAAFPAFSCHRRITSRFPDASRASAPSQRVALQKPQMRLSRTENRCCFGGYFRLSTPPG